MHLSASIAEPDGGAHGGEAIWLLCRAGSFLCALRLADVVEIMRVLRIEPIAGAPPFVRGLRCPSDRSRSKSAHASSPWRSTTYWASS
jgi:hypothetical protein